MLVAHCRQECEQRGATIIYATHIFDGLDRWMTHLAHVSDGELVRGGSWAAGRALEVPSAWDCSGCHGTELGLKAVQHR